MNAKPKFLATDGDGYELQMGRWSRRLAPLLVDFAGIERGDAILDVGCGTGSLCAHLAGKPNIGQVRGIDLSPAYIAHAIRTKRDHRVRFEVGDACALPFPDGSFAHSLSLLALQFAPDIDLAVREMRRVTRPGGVVAAATWDTRGGFVAFRMVLDAAAVVAPEGQRERARAYTRRLSRPGELEEAWTNAGLIDVAQDMRTIRMDFVSFADFWTPVAGAEGPIAEFVQTLDKDTQARLQEAVRSAYLDGDPDGPRSYAATAWVVRGRSP